MPCLVLSHLVLSCLFCNYPVLLCSISVVPRLFIVVNATQKSHSICHTHTPPPIPPRLRPPKTNKIHPQSSFIPSVCGDGVDRVGAGAAMRRRSRPRKWTTASATTLARATTATRAAGTCTSVSTRWTDFDTVLLLLLLPGVHALSTGSGRGFETPPDFRSISLFPRVVFGGGWRAVTMLAGGHRGQALDRDRVS